MLGLSLTGPAFAQPDVRPHSLDAMGCMKLRECQENVYPIRSYAQLADHFGDHWASDYKDEIENLIISLNKSGVEVYIADHAYFPNMHRGLYYTDVNRMFLNDVYVYDPATFLAVLRHEGWHAAQDCMAGGIDNSFIAVIHDDELVPQKFKMLADLRYGGIMKNVIPWEQEAIWASDIPNMTADALAVCAAGPMWDTYEPTSMTREWLVDNQHIK